MSAKQITERQTAARSDSVLLLQFLTANQMANKLQTKVVQINRVANKTLAGW